MNEDEKGWKDKRIISPETLKELPKDMFQKSPDPRKKEIKGNPNQEEPFVPRNV